jgi:hypothetical protein
LALYQSPRDPSEPGTFLATDTGIYRMTADGPVPWAGASTLEELTELLDRAGRAYVLEEEARGRIWIHCH